MAGFGEQLQAAAPMFLGIGSQLSGRDPMGIARGMALMQAKSESDKRKAAINNMLSGMGIAGPQKAFLESMPPEAQQQWILQQMAPQEPVRGVQMGDRLVNPITGEVIADYSTPAQPFPWPDDGNGTGGAGYTVGGNVRMEGVSDPAMQAWNTFASGWSGPELNVTSAYRDPNYNSRVGGAKNSQHTHGNAFDFSTSGWTQEQKQAAVQRALDAGFTGVGVYGDSLHFDTGPRRVWGPSYGKESAPEWAAAMVMGGGSATPRPQTSAQSPNIDTQIASYTKAIDVYDRALAANLGSPSERKVAEDKRDRLIKMRDEAIKRQQEAAKAAGETDQRARKIAEYMDVYGYDKATAIALADDIIAISRDPLTGEATLVDKRSILGAKDAYGADAPVDAGAGQVPPLSFHLPGVNDAFGLEGFGKGLANTGADIFGAPVPFESVQEAQSDFAVLKEDILSDLANGYRRQPPSWVLQALDALTPKAGQPFSGAQGAQSKLRALDRKFEREIGLAQQQLKRRMKPADRAEIEGQLTALEAARARVRGMLGAFGGGGASGIPQLFIDGVGDLPDGLTAADVWAEMSDDEKAAFQQ